MKLFLILLASISAGIISVDHLHSFMLGLSVSALAVGSCYWFAFRSTRVPHFALFMLICGVMAKLVVTVVGVIIGANAGLITSPIIFALSYLFFSVIITYLWFAYRESITHIPERFLKRKVLKNASNVAMR